MHYLIESFISHTSFTISQPSMVSDTASLPGTPQSNPECIVSLDEDKDRFIAEAAQLQEKQTIKKWVDRWFTMNFLFIWWWI